MRWKLNCSGKSQVAWMFGHRYISCSYFAILERSDLIEGEIWAEHNLDALGGLPQQEMMGVYAMLRSFYVYV